jgi:transcriptional antiterminator NusG
MEEAARWYIVSVYSGLENRVVEAIKEQAAKKGLLGLFHEFLIPCEQVVEINHGQKVTKTRTYFPGYVLVKVEMRDDIWSLICGLPRVNGFLGAKKPLPISEAEVHRILDQIKESQARPRRTISFEIGETVKVTEGPFASFQGTIDSVDDEKERLTVSVMILSRPTPIDLDYSQVEKS